MSTPKKDWIFTAVLLVLIAALSAVVVMRYWPAGSSPRPGRGAVATSEESAPAGTEADAPISSGETLYSPPAAHDGAETTYSAAAGATGNAPAARTPRTATVRTDTNYSAPGRAARPVGAGKAVPGAAPTKATSGTAVLLASGQEKDSFPYLGLVNPFDPIVTPAPTPTQPPPPTPQPNNLNRALQNWVIEYPLKRGAQWVFSDKVKKDQNYTVDVGQPFHLKDVTEFDAQVTANGKWGVQLEYQGQVKKFSMVE